jgi:hypothetical protein
MISILPSLLLAPLAANPSVLDSTWHLVAVEEDGQAFAPGTATLTVGRGRFEAKDDHGALAGLIVLHSTRACSTGALRTAGRSPVLVGSCGNQ